jgi:hypothetical protein
MCKDVSITISEAEDVYINKICTFLRVKNLGRKRASMKINNSCTMR